MKKQKSSVAGSPRTGHHEANQKQIRSKSEADEANQVNRRKEPVNRNQVNRKKLTGANQKKMKQIKLTETVNRKQ